jgi:hypothetical protein
MLYLHLYGKCFYTGYYGSRFIRINSLFLISPPSDFSTFTGSGLTDSYSFVVSIISFLCRVKNIVSFYLLLFLSAQCFGQVKILFDASKAQMCSNADWVIDADVRNIGTGNGGAMVVGQGNESNPQRIPTPAQAGITSSTPETYWDGALSSWGIDMVKQGYVVETLPYNGTISYGNSNNPQDLSNYKVFISDEPNIQFTTSEKNALVQFVQHGGGLFIITHHHKSDRNFDGWDSPHIWNDLMTTNTIQANPFGMSFDYLNFSQLSTNVASLPSDSCLHGVMGAPSQLNYSNGTSITLNTSQNSSVKGLFYKNGSSTTGSTDALVAVCRYGKGKVAALGDSSPPDDGTGDPNDSNLYNGYWNEANGSHRKLLVNTTIWLAATDNDTVATSINEPQKPATDLLIYPNPANNTLTVVLTDANTNTAVQVYSITGQLLLQAAATNRYFTIDISALQPGMYIVNANGIMRRFLKL